MREKAAKIGKEYVRVRGCGERGSERERERERERDRGSVVKRKERNEETYRETRTQVRNGERQ